MSSQQQEWQKRFEEIIEDRSRHSPYYLLLGMRIKELHPGEAHLELETGPHHLDSGGHVHPGVIFSLADAAAGVAAATSVPGGSRRVVTVEMKVSYLAAIGEGRLVAVGRVIGMDGPAIFSEAEVSLEGGEKVAKGTATFMAIRKSPTLAASRRSPS